MAPRRGQPQREQYPHLVRSQGAKAATLLAKLLSLALSAERHLGHLDYSTIWRPAIEDHEANSPNDVADHLVSALRDAVVQLMDERPAEAERMVVTLLTDPGTVFRRIALYTLAARPQACSGVAAQALGDFALVDDEHLRREYGQLVQARPALAAESMQPILDHIEEGPDRQELVGRLARVHGRKMSQTEIGISADIWRRDRLDVLLPALPETWRQTYDALVRARGEPYRPEPGRCVFRRMDDESPLTVDDIRGMSVDEIAAFLRDWAPGGDAPGDPTPDGLASALAEAVASGPGRYAGSADALIGCAPVYVSSVLSALLRSVEDGASLPWGPPLRLCAWVFTAPEPAATAPRSEFGDPGWAWVKQQIGRLTYAAITRDGIATEHRDDVWATIVALLSDPHPSQADDERMARSGMGPREGSFNTTRSVALRCAVQFGVWCVRGLRSPDRRCLAGPDAWEAIPEVAAALERHLDPVADASPLARAAYGEMLGALAWIGMSWVTQNLEALLPADSGLAHLREATWGAYLIANRPSRDLLPILRRAYQRAVEALGSPEALNWGRQTPSRHLALHLIALYWSGDVQLDDRLLTTFYRHADAELSGAVIEAVTHSLCKPGAADAAILQRLSRLLERRVAQRQLGSGGSDAKEELQWYGGWVASRKFPEQWALQLLSHVLALTGGRITPDWQVAEALAEIAPRRPAQAVSCIVAMARACEAGWELHMWRDQLRAVLQEAITSDDEAAANTAMGLIHELGERGVTDLQDLLP